MLLKFHLGVTKEEREAIIKKYNLVAVSPDEQMGKIGYLKVLIPDGRDVMEVAKVIRTEYKLKVPEPNYVASTLAVSDPLYGNQWYIPDATFDKAWEKVKSRSKITVAVIDTGINSSHPDLNGRVVSEYDFVNNDNDPEDDHVHGTFVSGIIAAQANDIGIKGLYGYAQILPVKVIDSNGVGTYDRILGGGDFVSRILDDAEARQARQLRNQRAGLTIHAIIDEECRRAE